MFLCPPSSSPVAVDVQYDVRGADGDGHLVPLVISQAVGEHLGVGLLASGAVVKTHLAALAAALQLQEPAGGKAAAVILPRAAGRWSLTLFSVLFDHTAMTSFIKHRGPGGREVEHQQLTIAHILAF